MKSMCILIHTYVIRICKFLKNLSKDSLTVYFKLYDAAIFSIAYIIMRGGDKIGTKVNRPR